MIRTFNTHWRARWSMGVHWLRNPSRFIASIQNRTRIWRNSEMQSQTFSVSELTNSGGGKWWTQWQDEYLRTALMFLSTFSVSTMALSWSNMNDDVILPMLNRKPDGCISMTRKQDLLRRLWWAASLHENAKYISPMWKSERPRSKMKSGKDAWYQKTWSSWV